MAANIRKRAFAPQNAFLENIVRKANNNNSYRCFVLANARIEGYPIVYSSDRFCAVTGFNRHELMTQSGKFDFLRAENLKGEKHEQQFHQYEQFLEILCHGTMGHVQLYFKRKLKHDDGLSIFSTEPILFMIHTVPIRNENEETVLFLFNFKDLGHQSSKAGSQINTHFGTEKSNMKKPWMNKNKHDPNKNDPNATSSHAK